MGGKFWNFTFFSKKVSKIKPTYLKCNNNDFSIGISVNFYYFLKNEFKGSQNVCQLDLITFPLIYESRLINPMMLCYVMFLDRVHVVLNMHWPIQQQTLTIEAISDFRITWSSVFSISIFSIIRRRGFAFNAFIYALSVHSLC